MLILRRLLLLVSALIVLLAGFITLRFGSALSQEGNPAQILKSIAKLEYSDKDHVLLDTTERGIRYVSLSSGQDRYAVVKRYMKQRDWDYKEQMGSGLVFERIGESIVIETRLYTKHYYLWDIPNEVIS